jgi:hypothetical protein
MKHVSQTAILSEHWAQQGMCSTVKSYQKLNRPKLTLDIFQPRLLTREGVGLSTWRWDRHFSRVR